MQISHINIEGKFTTKDQAWDLLNKIAKAGVIYFAFNAKISTCEKNHAFFGDICPRCGGHCTTKWSRVVGFYTPVETWAPERKIEFDKRTWFHEDEWLAIKDDMFNQ